MVKVSVATSWGDPVPGAGKQKSPFSSPCFPCAHGGDCAAALRAKTDGDRFPAPRP